MPLPASWTQITVTATYTRTDGAPARGQVLFTSLQAVIVGGETIVPHPIRAVLDEAGSFSAEIPSTDDPDISPTGWAWTVHEHIDGLLRSPYSIEVPFDGGSIDLATVAPVIPAEVADLTGSPCRDNLPYSMSCH